MGNVVAERFAVCLTELRLCRLRIPAHTDAISLRTREEDGSPVTLPWAIRVCVCQLIAFDDYVTQRVQEHLSAEAPIMCSSSADLGDASQERCRLPEETAVQTPHSAAGPIHIPPNKMPVNEKLIIDIGMSEGNDTAYYLRKGFSVIGVEADPNATELLEQRFELEIKSGHLRLMHRAASAASGEIVAFWRNVSEQSHSKLAQRDSPPPAGFEKVEVTTVGWSELQQIAGIPHYLKIDIEGGEQLFLSSMERSSGRPNFISVECQSPQPIEMLYALGYKSFRLINQIKLWDFTAPNPPLEGVYVPDPPRNYWSGLFGRELPGNKWYTYTEIMDIYRKVHEIWLMDTIFMGWLDCHATDAA